MASNLDCVGLAVADRGQFAALVESALAHAQPIGQVSGFTVHAWQDPSGARLVISTKGRRIVDLLPSFAGVPGARLADVRCANEDVAVCSVVDDGGEVVTMLAVELEQRRFLAVVGGPVAGEASVVALGVDITVHADERAFAAADVSPRMSAESFISHGVFGPPEQAQAYARMHGIVLRAETRTAAATGQSFVVARVRTVGFETDMCFPAAKDVAVPQPGSIAGGEVFLIASLPGIADAAGAGKTSPWSRWRRGRPLGPM